MDAYRIERDALGEPLRQDCTLVTVANALLDMGRSVDLDCICKSSDCRLDDVAAISEALKTRIVLTEFRTTMPGNAGEDIRPYYEAAASDGPRTTLFLVRGVKDHGGRCTCRRPCLGFSSRRRPQVFASKC